MDYTSESAAAGAAAGIGLGAVFFSLLLVVVIYAGLWKIFEKAGKPGWAAIIPIYNLIVLLEIVGKPMIWILFLLIPCVNIVFAIWLYNLLSKSFGKTEGYTVGMILLPIVFIPMLGFGDARYLGPSASEAQNGGPFGLNNNPFGANDPFNKPPTTPNV